MDALLPLSVLLGVSKLRIENCSHCPHPTVPRIPGCPVKHSSNIASGSNDNL